MKKTDVWKQIFTIFKPDYYKAMNTMLIYVLLNKKLLFLFFLIIATLNLQAQHMWLSVHKEFDEIVQTMEDIATHDDNRANCLPFITRLQIIARKERSTILLSRYCYWKSWYLLRQDIDSAGIYIEKAVAMLDTARYQYDYARLQFLQGHVFYEKGNYLEAYKICARLMSFFESVNDKQYLAYTKSNMGTVLLQLEDLQGAEKLLAQAVIQFEELGMKEKALKTQLNLARCYYLNGQPDKGIMLARRLLNSSYASKDRYFTICALRALSGYVDDIHEKQRVINHAYKHALAYGNLYLTNSILINKGEVELKLLELDAAMLSVKQVECYALEYKQPDMLRYVYDIYSSVYAKREQWDSAYFYSNRFRTLSEEVKGGKVLSELQRMQRKFEVEKYQMKLDQSIKQIRQQRNTILIVIIALLVVVILSSIIFYLIHKHAKMEKRLKKIELQRLDEQLKLEAYEKKQFKEEVDLKNRELSSNTLLLSNKNQILSEIIAEIDKLEQSDHIEKQDVIHFRKKLEENIKCDDDWQQNFKLHFENVHPDFFSTLKQRFPTLTENELRLCAYLKINLTTKQIAEMLSILPKTVTMAKYRMKLKMNLNDKKFEDLLRNV